MLIIWAKRQGMIISTVTLFYDSSKTKQKIMILDYFKIQVSLSQCDEEVCV